MNKEVVVNLKEIFQMYILIMKFLRSIFMFVLGATLFASGVINANIEHLALSLLLVTLCDYNLKD